MHRILPVLAPLGLGECGACAFADVGKLLPVRSAARIPQGAKSVIAIAVPYFAGEQKERNIAKYAAGPDYHGVIMALLLQACALLQARFAQHAFVPFCDASPIDERRAAYLAGLGVLGKNGMVIHKRFGSYFFVGEIVTTLSLAPNRPVLGECDGCMACIGACPGGAIGANGVDPNRCASHISQKKGELTQWEAALLQRAHTVWGCDICQDVCPLNQAVTPCAPQAFAQGLCFCVTQQNVQELYPTRAFAYRKKTVILRNLRILGPQTGNNKANGQA